MSVSLGFNSDLVVGEMREKMSLLGENKNFSFVDLGLSREDLETGQKFKIESREEYWRFGDADLVLEELPIFLGMVGKNDEQSISRIAQIIHRIALNVIQATRAETAWICVRTFIPEDTFDLPRWHMDGSYFPPYGDRALKFATVLKGNSTLFHQLDENSRKDFNAHWEDRERLSNLLKDKVIDSPGKGFGAFFLVGDGNVSAAHSEPKIDSERLFISVLPGNKNQIAEIQSIFVSFR